MSVTPDITRQATAFLNALFAHCEAHTASDIHLCAGLAPRFRVHGVLSPVSDYGIADQALYLSKNDGRNCVSLTGM